MQMRGQPRRISGKWRRLASSNLKEKDCVVGIHCEDSAIGRKNRRMVGTEVERARDFSGGDAISLDTTVDVGIKQRLVWRKAQERVDILYIDTLPEFASADVPDQD